MQEIELKLQVPAEQADAIDAAVAGSSRARRVRLVATYWDTPERDLAAARIGLRVRREGRQWVQTLKAASSDGITRFEHSVPLSAGGAPVADPTLHAGTRVGDRLLALLAERPDATLVPQYTTEVLRRRREMQVPGGRIELAFDRGTIAAGDAIVPVRELEIELVSGAPLAVIETARRWTAKYGLWLDSTSKSHRGVLLARGDLESPPTGAVSASLSHELSGDAAVREMVRACLQQVLANASDLAGGFGGVEHVHQLRVGIRRLRTALRVFGDLSPRANPEWDPRLAAVSLELGASRDRDVLTTTWLPQIVTAGGPDIALAQLTAAADADASDVARSTAFSLLMLELLRFTHEPAEARQADDLPLGEIVALRLQRLRRSVVGGSKRFAAAEEEQQHTVRKRLKRLRYSAELTTDLFTRKDVRRFLSTLQPAQDALGEINDLSVARSMFRAQTQTDPQAWFAVGWLSAKREEAVQHSARALHSVAKAKPYWPRHIDMGS